MYEDEEWNAFSSEWGRVTVEVLVLGVVLGLKAVSFSSAGPELVKRVIVMYKHDLRAHACPLLFLGYPGVTVLLASGSCCSK